MNFKRVLPVAIVCAVCAPPVLAQSDDNSGSAPSVIDLPLIGEVELPGFLSFLGSPAEESAGQNRPPPAVETVQADVQPVGDSFDFIGRITPIEQVAIMSRVPGFIQDVAFQGGASVTEGETLFQIDPAQYRAELQSAQAQLESAQAQEVDAERTLSRTQELRQSGTASQASLDDARAAYEAARGQTLQAEATLAQAQLNLDYTTITAPIDGQMSAPFMTRGNYVSASSGTLADLVQLDPIWGVFALGERRLATWRRLGIGQNAVAPVSSNDNPVAGGDPTSGRLSNGDFDLTLMLPDGSTYLSGGDFDFIGNTVDATSGTVEVRVRFPNPDGLLLPNQNVTLRVDESDPPRYPVIPQSAVQLSRDGSAVWVLQDDDTVRQVSIETVGTQQPGMTAVTAGLTGGERIVTRGGSTLRDGQTVAPRQEGQTATSQGQGGDAGEQQTQGGDQQDASQDQDGGSDQQQDGGSNGRSDGGADE